MHTVAIVPARGGSKGIPRKNVIDFCGHPLIAWTIACARRCRMIEAVYVSTDDVEISDVARAYKAQVIPRPPEISGDTSNSESALIHACEMLRENNIFPDAIVFLQATSPLRETSELDGALSEFKRGSVDSLFSAAQPEDMLLWLKDRFGLHSLNFDYRSRQRRQDLNHEQEIWIETGSFYVTRTDVLLESQNRLAGRIGFWPVPFWKSFEIDSMEGLNLCASLMRQHQLDRTVPTREAGD